VLGKSGLARRLPTILPAMTLPATLETTHIHRVAGRTGARTALVTARPCRAPHHTISDVGLIGGGQVPMPGDVSLAHHGRLVLDELPECRRHGLEVLRQRLKKRMKENTCAYSLDLSALTVLAGRFNLATGPCNQLTIHSHGISSRNPWNAIALFLKRHPFVSPPVEPTRNAPVLPAIHAGTIVIDTASPSAYDRADSL
jgi:Magnesium chelatase, subunit ChlI